MADVTDKTAMDEQVELALDERSTLRRVPGLSTELQDMQPDGKGRVRLEPFSRLPRETTTALRREAERVEAFVAD